MGKGRSNKSTSSLHVLWYPPMNRVESGIITPFAANPARTSGSLQMAAKSRPLGAPRPPAQAPQSWAASWGLLRLLDPWPQNEHIRRKVVGKPAAFEYGRGAGNPAIQIPPFRSPRFPSCKPIVSWVRVPPDTAATWNCISERGRPGYTAGNSKGH